MKQAKYTLVKDTVRPFRLWDARGKKAVPHRCYAYHDMALKGAWNELQWPGCPPVLEIYNIATGHHIATLKRERGGRFTRWVHPDWNYRRAQPEQKPAHKVKAPQPVVAPTTETVQ